MKHWDTVAIVGVGLIGGSIGLDLLGKKLARRVIGVGRRRTSLNSAKKLGVVTETTLDLARAVAEAQLVVVCTPVGRIADDVLAAARACRPKTVVTDAGSTKAAIVAAVEGKLPPGVGFVGGHPIAGSEKSGPTAAVRDLFRGRTTVVTPTPATPAAALRTVETLWKRLGARVLRMSPEEHDQTLAVTSHVPHLVASALAGTTPEAYLKFTAGGWLDTTRIAAADGELWLQIFQQNRAAMSAALQSFESRLTAFRLAVEQHDAAALKRLLADGKQRREAAQKLKRPPAANNSAE